MDQYSSIYSIYIYFICLLPIIVTKLFEKNYQILNLLTSITMLVLLFSTTSLQFYEFLFFLIFEVAIIYIYYNYSKKFNNKYIYFLLFGLSILPLAFIKIGARSEYSAYIGFMGISYISFKIWEVIINIHDKKIKELQFLDLINFLIFAPAFSSGPIIRYNTYITESRNKVLRNDYINNYLFIGIKKITIGMLYKFSIAFVINEYILIKCSPNSIIDIIVYMYGYTLYLFFDFAGYSLMAVGTAYIMGIRVPDNFNMPFLSRNIKEFWQRWHISLSTWFNDYLFSRFVLNNMRNKVFTDIKLATRCAYIFTMFTMGIWHGLYLHYIVYGLYHGVLLVLTDIWVKSKTYRKTTKKKYYNLVSRIICFNIVAFGMLIFSGFIF